MKKILLSLAAVAALASCSKDALIEEMPQAPITFGEAFVDNATKAIDATYSNTNKPASFSVYGTVKGAGISGAVEANIFDNATVTASGEDWNCSVTQYWVPMSDYKFTALTGSSTSVTVENNTFANSVTTDGTNMPTSVTYNAATQADLMLATQTVRTYTESNSVKTAINNYNTTVEFTFNHLLSKVHFTVKNSVPVDADNKTYGNYQYKVSDIKLKNTYLFNTYTISSGTWGNTGTANYITSFGNVSDKRNTDITAETPNNSNDPVFIPRGGCKTSHNSMLVIPANYTGLAVECTVGVYLGETHLYDYTYTKESVAANLQTGHAYNFIIEIGAPGSPIKFSIKTVNEWKTTTPGDDDDTTEETPNDVTVNPAQP